MMNNEVTTIKNTGMAALSALKTGLTNVRTKLPELGGSPYLRLLKDGDWVFGQQDTVVEKGTEAVINPLSVKHGYTAWTSRKPGEGKNIKLGEIMVDFNKYLPPVHELEQHKDPETGRPVPWKDQMSVDVKFLSGKHKGTQVQWRVSSVGGLNAARAIIDQILAKLDQGTPFVCPIVTFDSDSYRHETYGKTYVPKIEIVGWMDFEGNEEGADEVVGPSPVKRVEEALEEADADEDEAPRRRRRRD